MFCYFSFPFCISIILSLNQSRRFVSFANIRMPNPTTNKMKKSKTKDERIRDIRFLFRPKQKDNGINDNTLRDMRIMFEPDNEDYYEPVRIINAFNNNYIEHESNGDIDKTLSIKEYLDKITAYLSDMINDHKTQVKLKIQLTIRINCMSSKDSNETHTMNLKSDFDW